MATEETDKTDVFICGAGPVGLVLAYQLLRLNISVHIIDSADKASPSFPMYGRASTLQPRTLEILDQLDLYDPLAQEALCSNRTFTYKNGKRLHGGGFKHIEEARGTFFNHALNLRLKFSEDIFREKIEEMGCFVDAPTKLVGLEVHDEEEEEEEYKIVAECQDSTGNVKQIKARYIVGCDGGGSSVRKLAKIPFPGEHKDRHWVRIDGVVKTNIPEARVGFGALESASHGQVLWVALDHGATRIGYVLTKQLFEKYGFAMTQEQAVYEAKLAVAPFELEFAQVDWHTVYGIQQRVAERLVDREKILLAGDAAHTHSSGTAQGMNTGMHDVVSLGWRLAGVLKEWYPQSVLENYSDERKAVAEQLVDNDRTISSLIGGEKPESMKDRPEADAMKLLSEFYDKIADFNLGLGVIYPSVNLLNDGHHAYPPVKVAPGHRSLDALLAKPGLRRQNIRFHEVTKNNGKFKVVIFAGKPGLTGPTLRELRAEVDKHKQRYAHAVEYVTILEGLGLAFDETLGVRKFGNAYWDIDSSAHWTYGVADLEGAILVLRPDGILGTSAPLKGFEEIVVPYLDRLIVPRDPAKLKRPNGHGNIGELLNPFENNLLHSRKNAEVPA